jgi:Type I phosphodiesterase / nucleotide pyrophosphatase
MRPSRVLRALTIHLGATLAFTLLAAAADLRTRNVILITVDGLRIQELFGGMDPIVSGNDKRSGIYDLERARARYWRPTREERREALMPYFWKTLAPRGIVLGDKEKGSSVLVTNPLLFSAPGYAEILTGRPQADVTTNDVKRYPHPTILEFARRELKLDGRQVATFGSWEGFKTLSSSREGDFFTNAGYERIPPAMATPRMALLSDLQFQVMALWEEGRSDAITFGLAVEYLKRQRPRLLYVALGEPDDWAHARRYDRLLDYLQVLDGYLRELWRTLEGSDFYRGRTTVILTTDHGRGVRPSDWVEHGEGIEGSQDIWIAVVGPDTPHLGDAAPSATVHQADVAATLLRFLGLDPAKFDPQAGPPIAQAFSR